MTTPRLLPCPCCGGPAGYSIQECGGYAVVCTGKMCVTSGVLHYACGDEPAPLMAEIWNTRRPASHSQLETLRQVEQMAAYYGAPKGFFDWLDLQVTLHGGTPNLPAPGGSRLEVTPGTAAEGRA